MADAYPQSRNEAFGEGAEGGPVLPQAQQADPVFHSDSVLDLQNGYPSSNGLSQKDAPRRLYSGGMRPTANGMSQNTYDVAQPLQSQLLNV